MRSLSRRSWARTSASLALLMGALASCTVETSGLPQAAGSKTGATATPSLAPTAPRSGDPRTAGGNVERETSPAPTATATPTPTLQPTPTPTPEETPVAVLYSMRVTISPRSLSLFLPAPQGTNAPGYPGAASLSAEVLMSDASTNNT